MKAKVKEKEKRGESATLAALERVRERDHKLRRAQGSLSCAECRRMRIRCNRKIPCSSCIRRKCSEVCPTGTKIKSSAPEDVEEAEPQMLVKERRLFLMSERIAILEDALHIHCGESHPLLEPSLVLERVKLLSSVAHGIEDPVTSADDILEELGATIVVNGDQIKYIGSTNTEYEIVRKVMDFSSISRPRPFSMQLPLSYNLLQACDMFPFPPSYLRHSSSYSQLLRHLPTYSRVSSLVESYITNLSWFLLPVDSAQIREQLLPTFYSNFNPMLATSQDWNVSLLPSLALLYTVFACGAAADWTQDPVNEEGETFEHLARCALGLCDVFEGGGGIGNGGGSVVAVQAMLCLSVYEILTLRKLDREADWRLLAYSLSAIASLGLHRDPSIWNIDEAQADRYRRLFWQANWMDKFRSMSCGRPTIFNPSSINCKFPKDDGLIVEKDGTEIESIWQWRNRFCRDVVTPFTELITSTKPVAYSQVLAFDKEWREFKIHPYCMKSPEPSDGVVERSELDKHHPMVTMWWKHLTLQRLHRNFFARALSENPRNPTRSRFSRSFAQVFDSSARLLELAISGFEVLLRFFVRVHSMWANALVSSVVMSAVACRVTEGSYAAQALDYLSRMLQVFEDAKDHHPIALHGREFLAKLRQRGLDAQTRFAMSNPSSTTSPFACSSNNGLSVADESPVSIEALLAANDPSFGDADLRVLRNTSAQIVEPTLPSPTGQFRTSGSSAASSASQSRPSSPSCSAHTPAPLSSSLPPVFDSTILSDADGLLSVGTTQPTGKQTSSPWSSDSCGSWSTIASEFGLDQQELGIWRGVDPEWDFMAA